MHIVMFYHSLLSDWNHGNAHFLRGVVSEFLDKGHQVTVYEPRMGWSLSNLLNQHGPHAIDEFRQFYPGLQSEMYDLPSLDLEQALDTADLVIVHEWSDHGLVKRIGDHRARHPHYLLLFHDTHHRSLTDRGSIAAYDLRDYDGVLAFGQVIRDLYIDKGWAENAWVWHEAADVRRFHPTDGISRDQDLVWIGNWGDDERTEELYEYLFNPALELGLHARIFGVRYPAYARQHLLRMGFRYEGWLPNYRVPEVFARHKVTVHVPRRPYVEALTGIPTIRVFEAMACGIPLICAPWQDSEGLFHPGKDYLIARNGQEMKRHLRDLIFDQDMASELGTHARQTILTRHTCGHRVEELFGICSQLKRGRAIETTLPATH